MKEDIEKVVKVNKTMKKYNKIKFFLLIFIFILILFSLYSFFFNEKSISKRSKLEKPAYLNSFSGEVKVFRNGSWINVEKEQELFLGESVKTLNGKAQIILQERANIYLEENSQIKINSVDKNNLSIIQLKGVSYNIFSKSDQYSYLIETNYAKLSVKGTEFIVKVLDNQESLFVKNGQVLVQTEEQEVLVQKYDVAKIENGKVKIVLPEKEQIIEIFQTNVKLIEKLKEERIRKIEENSMLLKIAEKTYGLTKEDIILKLDAIDKAEIDDAALIEKAAFKKDELLEIKKINDKIKYLNAEIKYIKDKFGENYIK